MNTEISQLRVKSETSHRHQKKSEIKQSQLSLIKVYCILLNFAAFCPNIPMKLERSRYSSKRMQSIKTFSHDGVI